MPDGSNIAPTDFPPASSIRPNPDYVPAYINAPPSWSFDIDQSNGISRATYIGEVFIGGQGANNQAATKGDIAAATTGVSSFNTRTGAVTLTAGDLSGAGGALLASPAFTGNPTAPTPAPGDSDNSLATTAFVMGAIGTLQAATVASFNGRTGAVSLTTGDVTGAGGAPLASPTFTGNPTAPTMGITDSSSALATTAFVQNTIAGKTVTSWNGRQGNVSLTLSDITSAGGAPINSPTFTGVPSVPTATVGTATTQAASTAFVVNQIASVSSGVTTFNGRSGAVTLQAADVSGVGGALLAGPAFTGNPTAPTQTAGTSNTTLATTAFVANAITGLPGVSSFNTRQGAVTLQLADVTSVGGAPLASPNLSGTPTSTTPAPGDNSTRIATTAYVLAAGFAPLASPTFTGTPTAPTPAALDNSTKIATTAFVTSASAATSQAAFDNAGRNLLHNGTFTVQQRGTGPWTASSNYTADRWFIATINDTVSASIQTLADADRTAIGDETAQYALQNIFTGSATAGSFDGLIQRMENVRRLSGKAVTVSFWARATSGTPRLSLAFIQNFGTGGSPSANVTTAVGPTANLSSTWTRYVLTATVPSVAGKTFGTTAGTDYMAVTIGCSDQGNVWGNGIGVQNGTIQLWGVQLEIGSQPTPLDAGGSPQQILAQCQRFASMVTVANRLTAAAAGGIFINSVYFPVTMRATPTFTVSTAGSSLNLASSTFFASGQSGGRFAITPNAAGDSYMLDQVYLLSADL